MLCAGNSHKHNMENSTHLETGAIRMIGGQSNVWCAEQLVADKPQPGLWKRVASNIDKQTLEMMEHQAKQEPQLETHLRS